MPALGSGFGIEVPRTSNLPKRSTQNSSLGKDLLIPLPTVALTQCCRCSSVPRHMRHSTTAGVSVTVEDFVRMDETFAHNKGKSLAAKDFLNSRWCKRVVLLTRAMHPWVTMQFVSLFRSHAVRASLIILKLVSAAAANALFFSSSAASLLKLGVPFFQGCVCLDVRKHGGDTRRFFWPRFRPTRTWTVARRRPPASACCARPSSASSPLAWATCSWAACKVSPQWPVNNCQHVLCHDFRVCIC